MNGAKLHTLATAELGIIHADCGLDVASGLRPPRRKEMVADILGWQQRWGTTSNTYSTEEETGKSHTTPSPNHNVRKSATPMRRRCGACERCGWQPQGVPSVLALCACGFVDMDPFRPVASVLGLVHLRYDEASRTEGCTIMVPSDSLDKDPCVELRMAKLGEPGRHVWPHSMSVCVDDVEFSCIDPPKDGRMHRSDSPLQLQHSSTQRPLNLKVTAWPKVFHKHSEFVICAVIVRQICSPAALLSHCLAQASLSNQHTADLWALLNSDCTVECASPWLHSLVCPLTQERMRIPARGINCKHISCFDLEAYVNTCARSAFQRRWFCPVCSHHLPVPELAVCEFTKALLNQTPGVTAVPLGSDARYALQAELQPMPSHSAVAPLSGRKRRKFPERLLREPLCKEGIPSRVSWGTRMRLKAGTQAVFDL